MAELRAEHFREFFFGLHDYDPFPWQESLAARVCAGSWPEVIDLPTASGKTACIDIALFALAVCENAAPRRIFFVVDRRVVVNEAYLRMCKVRDRLKNADGGLVFDVAQRFRTMARGGPDDEPLLVAEMRGGAFRDESWINNPLQPTVVTSTVDQVGSRLLFRGYGVSQNRWPLDAGLIGNDALIFLDEAHCSRAFAQTLQRLEQYRANGWASQPLNLPFQFVEMTATPSHNPKPENKLELSDRDREVEALQKRLEAEKPTKLLEVKGRKNDAAKLVDELASQALELAAEVNARRVALFVNRVKSAKLLYEELCEQMAGTDARVKLVIGSMRPVDRDDLEQELARSVKSNVERDQPDVPRTFVVSTQCLEVGADLDFDVLVTECASIDSLLQRFGRLDRLGKFGYARGAIVIGSWQLDPKQPDAVYGEALAHTWAWLKQMAGDGDRVNMGIRSRSGAPPTVKEAFHQVSPEERPKYCLPAEDAAILLPAHVDMLAQTNPTPAPDPLIEVFLHGPRQSAPEVQVVWRKDIDGVKPEEAIEIIKLRPPSTREAMRISLAAFKRWFTGGRDVLAQESDLASGTVIEIKETTPVVEAIAWNGEGGTTIHRSQDLKPGQTLVLKASCGGWNELGHIPPNKPIDVADQAAFKVRNGVTLRLHPEVISQWPDTASRQALVDGGSKADLQLDQLKDLLVAYRTDLIAEKDNRWPLEFLENLDQLRQPRLNLYPGGVSFYVLSGRRPGTRKSPSGPVLLEHHLKHVADAADRMASPLDKFLHATIVRAAKLHDYGKTDLRYQAWLRNGDHMAARYSPEPIAKSGRDVLISQKDVGLPEGFRHEMLSFLFAEKSPEAEGEMRDLILHLVSAHHGSCRPFAPVIPDAGADCVSYNGIEICKQERIYNAPHRLGRGIPDRFWRLTAAYGWWGLAYLEAMLRLADWRASSDETSEVSYD
jgi:CRISPR-associated endonuclease/helicase Cas3